MQDDQVEEYPGWLWKSRDDETTAVQGLAGIPAIHHEGNREAIELPYRALINSHLVLVIPF